MKFIFFVGPLDSLNLGAIFGGLDAYAEGGDLGDVVIGALFGGLTGFFGGAAGGAVYTAVLPTLAKE